MKKLCLILLTISLFVASSAFGIDYGDDVYVAVESSGPTLTYSEDFSGATTCWSGSSETCDNTHTLDYGWDSDIDGDYDGSALGGNFAVQCLGISATGWVDRWVRSEGSSTSVEYIRFDLYVDNVDDGTNTPIFGLVGDGNDYGTNLRTSIRADNSGGTLTLYLDYANGTNTDSYAASFDTAYNIEIYFDDTANTLQWWVDGVDQGEHSVDPGGPFFDILFGPSNAGNPAIYVDNIHRSASRMGS